MTNYEEFIKSKILSTPASGFDVELNDLNPFLFNWQKPIIRWALKKGCAALFEECGTGKTIQQLEWAHQVCRFTGCNVLILAPLAVSHQTVHEGIKFGINSNLCGSQKDVKPGVNITNYEKLHHFDLNSFIGVVLDESSIIKHHNSQTRQIMINAFRNTPYKLACTATPAPNDYMELGNHAEFLGVMSRVEMLSTFFVHDSGDTSKWRLKGHANEKFWEWVASWACVIQNPSDLGYDATDYELPDLIMKEHIIQKTEMERSDGQIMLLPQISQSLNERRQARRESLNDRVECAARIANATDEQVLVWCDLNAESELLSKSINGAVEVSGSHSDAHKSAAMTSFTNGDVRVLVSKPSIAGWGMNWQQCRNVIFVGLSDSFESYYQAVRRCWRYGQTQPVNVHIITSVCEGAVSENIKRKQNNARHMMTQMAKYTKNILHDEIHRTRKINESYHATHPIMLPSFMEVSA